MAREVLIRTWCDRHLGDDGTKVDGVEHTIRIDGLERVLALCGECEDVLGLEALVALMEDAGQVQPSELAPGKRPRTGGRQPAEGAVRYPCPLCDQDMVALEAHLRQQHGMATIEVFGLTCPVCGQECATPTGVGAHIGARHKDVLARGTGMVGAWFWAQAHGDPAGVVAARTAILDRMRAA